MSRPPVIILAAVVFLANAYCACASGSAERLSAALQDAGNAGIRSHPGCHGHSASSEGQSQPEHESPSCGHCRGTVTADRSGDKSILPAPLLSPIFLVALPADCSAAAGGFPGNSFRCLERPPPLPPPTLLHLACRLNT
jgi:hypothetical protein